MQNKIPLHRIHAALGQAIQSFAFEVGGALTGAKANFNVASSDSFPLYWTVSFCEQDPTADEVVVLSVDVWTDGLNIRLSCDLSDGTGTILAQGPVAEDDDSFARAPQLDAWLAEARTFISTCVTKAIAAGRARGL